MDLSSKVRVVAPVLTSGSRNVSRNRPGSEAIVGFTGEEKIKIRRPDGALTICAVNCVLTPPMKSRRAAAWQSTGISVIFVTELGRDEVGTNTRLFSNTV